MIESKEEHAARLTGNERGILAQELATEEKTRHHWRPLLAKVLQIASMPNDAPREPPPCEIQRATHEGDDGVRYSEAGVMLSNEQMTELGMNEQARATVCLDALRRISCLVNDAKPGSPPSEERTPVAFFVRRASNEPPYEIRSFTSSAIYARAEAWYRLYFELPVKAP